MKAPSTTDAARVEAEPVPIAARPMATPARRRAWIVGTVAAGALASIAWVVVPRGEAASPGTSTSTSHAGDTTPAPQAGSSGAATQGETVRPSASAPMPSSAAPSASAPTTAAATATAADSPAAALDTTAPPADGVAPAPAAPATAPDEPKPERRTGKPARPRTTSPAAMDSGPASKPASPTLPAPFDPDAPAPRVR